jgi:hypothetical protein
MICTFANASTYTAIVKVESSGTRTGTVEKNITEWSDVGGLQNCQLWTPEADTIESGLVFEQNRDCDQDQQRTKDIFIVYDNGMEVYEKTITETQTIIINETQESIGTKAPYSDSFKITVNAPSNYNYFGQSSDISGDKIIIGDEYGNAQNGVAYIFRKDGDSWVQEAKLEASDKALDDKFGSAVAIDGNIAVVGAEGEDTGGSGAGAAYIYRFNGTSWIQEAKILASDKRKYAKFGDVIDISGSTIVVGSKENGTVGIDAGSAYVFKHNGSSWYQETILLSNDISRDDNFGSSVSIEGNRIVVGNGGGFSKSAYVFKHNGTSWNQEAEIKGEGIAVAISGNLIISGANNEDNTGAAYIYRFNGTSWIEEQRIKHSNPKTYDNFGRTVAVNGDTIVIGSGGDAGGVSDAGSAYIFKYENSSWVEKVQLYSDTPKSYGGYADSLNVTSDGSIVLGASREVTAGASDGAVYIYK